MLNYTKVTMNSITSYDLNGLITAKFRRAYDVCDAEGVEIVIHVDETPLTDDERNDVYDWSAGEYDSPPAIDVLLRFLNETDGSVHTGTYIMER